MHSAALERGRELFVKARARSTDPMMKGETTMNDQNRVLARRGARDLTGEEVEQVCGGLRRKKHE